MMDANRQPVVQAMPAKPSQPATSSRIVEFDLLRGFFLLVVIINHVELLPSGWDYISGRGQLWVSAAEGFFFVSGLLVGLIYRKKLAQGMAFVFRKLWSRALLLYVCAVSLTLLYTAWAIAHGDPDSIKYAGATVLDWGTVVDTLRLNYVYGWSDFLTYYVAFMLGAPIVLFLLKRKLWWLVVGISIFIWLNRGDSFIRGWQVIFNGGMLAGYYWHNLRALVGKWSERKQSIAWRAIVWSAALTVMISFANLFVLEYLRVNLASLPAWLASFTGSWYSASEFVWPYFDKWTIEPGRIAMFALWFTAAFLMLQRYKSYLPHKITKVLNLFGQNSLYVYGVHSVIVFAVHAYLPKDAGFWFNFVVTSAVIALMIGLTYLKVVLSKRYTQSKRHKTELTKTKA